MQKARKKGGGLEKVLIRSRPPSWQSDIKLYKINPIKK